MATDSTSSRDIPPSRFQAEIELLQLLCTESVYPWNPSEPETEAYFVELEQELLSTGWSTEKVESHWHSLSAEVEQLWATVETEVATKTATKPSFLQQFASRMPQNLLDAIVHKAQQVLDTNLSLADQLVHCVEGVLPNWGEEDLQVLARPLAFAMRGTAEVEMMEAALRSVRCAAWTELSGVEQARLSLAIARYAIAQLDRPSAKA